MSKEQLDKILEKIRKLLALAGNNSNQHEASSAAEMAKRLLTEYNLSLTDVELREIVTKEVVFEGLSNISAWKSALAVQVSRVFDCHVYLSRRTSNGSIKLVFVGNKSDSEVATYVYQYLFSVIEKLIDNKVKSNTTAVHGNSIRNDYSLGIISVLGKRLEDFYGKEKEINDTKINAYGKTGKEVMVIKQDAISKWIAENIGKLKNKKLGGSEVDVDTYNDGQADGNNIQLSHAIKSTGKTASGYLN